MNNTGENLIVNDASNILDNLLLYEIAAKVLKNDEISLILDEGKLKFIEHFKDIPQAHIKSIEPMINSIVETKKQLIMSIKKGDNND
jgi:hypothetical protein